MAGRGAVAEARRLEVFVEVGFEGEGFVAFAAVMRLGSRVGLHVGPQIRPVREGLAAVSTAVRLLTRMRAHMALQEPRPTKGLPADGTDM